MKRAPSRLFILSAMLLSAGLAWAAAPPVVVTHTVTGYSAGDKTAAIDISVHVANPGDTSLSNLALSLVPLPPLAPGQTTLNVATLGPHESVDLPLQVTAPAFFNAEDISRRPLFWAGKCVDAQGTPVKFPATSHSGGAR